MRLLNSASMELTEVPDTNYLTYAILSHRWQDDEVTFKDMEHGVAKKKYGYAKLEQLCERAAKDGWEYVWADTCCIDKASSAELSESINSMYRWYQNAKVCYAYLFDVNDANVSDDSTFGKSQWFERGWTLQELIAPLEVEFYNSKWVKLGTKQGLKGTIAKITGIDTEVLNGGDPGIFSVARRMSWASNRRTTRDEDIAYSLLGLFGVNMPMLYGEGTRAFIRLQEEIMKQSDDHSLFAWTSENTGYRGLLAESPSNFRNCQDITRISGSNRVPYSVTNMGLSIELSMTPWVMDTYLAALDCQRGDRPNSQVGIFLTLLPETGQYARVLQDGTDVRDFKQELIPKSERRKIYVRQNINVPRPLIERMYGFRLRKLPQAAEIRIRHWKSGIGDYEGDGDEKGSFSSWISWDRGEKILKIPAGECGTAGFIWCRQNSGHYYAVLELGFDTMFNPVYRVGRSRLQPCERSFDVHWHRGSHSEFRGDRLGGLNENTLSITEHEIGNQRVWVVDISAL